MRCILNSVVHCSRLFDLRESTCKHRGSEVASYRIDVLLPALAAATLIQREATIMKSTPRSTDIYARESILSPVYNDTNCLRRRSKGSLSVRCVESRGGGKKKKSGYESQLTFLIRLALFCQLCTPELSFGGRENVGKIFI